MRKPIWYIVSVLLLIFGFETYLAMVHHHLPDLDGIPLAPTPQPQLSLSATPSSHVVTIWAWGTGAKSLQLLVPSFEQLHPDIKINIVDTPVESIDAQVTTAHPPEATQLPDVIQVNSTLASEYTQMGLFADLTPFAQQFSHDIPAELWTPMTQNHHFFGIPWFRSPVVLFYRRSVLQKAHIQPESLHTWDQVIQAGQKVRQLSDSAGNHPYYMMVLSTHSDQIGLFEILLQELGGRVLDDQGHPAFNTAQGVTALKLMKNIVQSGTAQTAYDWWSPEFFQTLHTGTIATYTEASWFTGVIKDNAPETAGQWGVLPLPTITSSSNQGAVNGHSYLAVLKQSLHQSGAEQFIAYALTNKTAQLQMYQAYNNLPALQSANQDPTLRQPDPFFANQAVGQEFLQAQAKEESATLTHGFEPEYDHVTKILNQEVMQAMNNQKTPEQALSDAATQVQKLSPSSVSY